MIGPRQDWNPTGQWSHPVALCQIHEDSVSNGLNRAIPATSHTSLFLFILTPYVQLSVTDLSYLGYVSILWYQNTTQASSSQHCAMNCLSLLSETLILLNTDACNSPQLKPQTKTFCFLLASRTSTIMGHVTRTWEANKSKGTLFIASLSLVSPIILTQRMDQREPQAQLC